MLLRMLLGLLLGALWLLLVRAGWLACSQPERARVWMDARLPFTHSWHRLFMAEGGDRIMFMRFQGVALIFAMLFLAEDLAFWWIRLFHP
jgi:hypothetical protein